MKSIIFSTTNYTHRHSDYSPRTTAYVTDEGEARAAFYTGGIRIQGSVAEMKALSALFLEAAEKGEALLTEQCENCEGSGIVEIPVCDQNHDDDLEGPCPQCNGEGQALDADEITGPYTSKSEAEA